MKKILALVFAASIMLYAPQAFGFGGCEEDCQKCHSLSKEEVRPILDKIQATEAQVMDIKMSQIGGLWEVTLEDKGMQGTMYVSFSKKYIVGGPIFEVDEIAKAAAQKQPAAEPERKVDFSKIPLNDALVMGDKKAPVKIAVFTCPDCSFCGKLHEELKKVLAERKDVAFYLKLMPLKFHPDAYWKSQSILCNKSIRLLEDNFAGKQIPKPSCTDTKEIDDNLKLAEEFGITGTPTMVLPDGRVAVGAKDAKKILELIGNPSEKQK
jgi:thiol:disulfide interchange protein DsbC